MISTSFRVALSALFFAGALGLASTGAARARKRHEGVRRRLEGRQGQQHDQRHDVAGVPEAVPRSEGDRHDSRRGACRRARCGAGSSAGPDRPRCRPTSRSRYRRKRPLGRPEPANSPPRRKRRRAAPATQSCGSTPSLTSITTPAPAATARPSRAPICAKPTRPPPATAPPRAGSVSRSSSHKAAQGAAIRETSDAQRRAQASKR